MITGYLTQREMSNERADAAERRAYLDDLWADSVARERDFWVALLDEAVEVVKESPEPVHWPDGHAVALGGGARVRQVSRSTGSDELRLEISHGGVSHTLTTVGWYDEDSGQYRWMRGKMWAYAREVRGFRRLLRRREAALEEAYHAALAGLPTETEERLGRAYGLALAGAVVLNEDGSATVASQSTTGVHYPVNGRCTCPDARNGAPVVRGVPACKHQIAVWLVKKSQEVK